jgi:hypothetical protein
MMAADDNNDPLMNVGKLCYEDRGRKRKEDDVRYNTMQCIGLQ